ncbi:hypothetical protein [Rhodoluna sp. KAS3]|uniref:hypothetical protein n=1 Tax=Rhodoluna sp. KAS3 TaxID=942880 RepID=UPI002230F1B6|nr:hypothetical protein [Rhodoluna sp. KAS3]BDS48633.1 hypothetical protein RKAS3_02100 [Rhodoluna sp. KAS3]
MSATLEKPAKPGNTRVTGKEQYYTPTYLALDLIREVEKTVPGLSSRTILEPAGGTGSFIRAAKAIGAEKFESFDIEPKHPGVTKADFLSATILSSNAVTISNPPFGRNNSLSIPFFNKAADHSDYICFIVPRSWRKWSVINRLDRRFHLIADHDIHVDYEDETGTKISQRNSLATCFQIWQRKPELRPKYSVVDNGFISKVSAEDADIALTIFGFGCGKVHTDFERAPNSTRMFLKLNHADALAALQSANFAKFHQHTAYTPALSLPEINYLLNEAIMGNPQLIETV